jgi:hypothetical protein
VEAAEEPLSQEEVLKRKRAERIEVRKLVRLQIPHWVILSTVDDNESPCVSVGCWCCFLDTSDRIIPCFAS